MLNLKKTLLIIGLMTSSCAKQPIYIPPTDVVPLPVCDTVVNTLLLRPAKKPTPRAYVSLLECVELLQTWASEVSRPI